VLRRALPVIGAMAGPNGNFSGFDSEQIRRVIQSAGLNDPVHTLDALDRVLEGASRLQNVDRQQIERDRQTLSNARERFLQLQSCARAVIEVASTHEAQNPLVSQATSDPQPYYRALQTTGDRLSNIAQCTAILHEQGAILTLPRDIMVKCALRHAAAATVNGYAADTFATEAQCAPFESLLRDARHR